MWFPRRPEHTSQGAVFVIAVSFQTEKKQTGIATGIRVVGPHLIKIYLAITSLSEFNNVR